MKKIGIVSLGYAWMPCEPGPSRFYYIAKLFAEHGYEVEVITSDFQHFQKKRRDIDTIYRQNYPFKLSFIKVPPYKKNIDPRRVYSNRVAVSRVVSHLKNHTYDAVYCSIPANDIAAKVGQYCKKRGIPFIIDIEDLWPEAMQMVVKLPVIKQLIFAYFRRDAETAYKCADAVIGTSDDYTNRAFLHQQRDICKATVYVGCDMDIFEQGAKDYVQEIDKPKDEFWVTYAGSLGTSYDIRTMILSAAEIQKERNSQGRKICFKILGTGPMKAELEELCKSSGCKNVEFLGYVAYPKMAAYLVQSDVLINSFVKGAPQSIVNKVGDYLAAGKPMINTLENPEFVQLVDRQNFGCNIEPENVAALTNAICRYEQDIRLTSEQGQCARKTAQEMFDRKVSYRRILEITEQVMEH